MSLLELEHVSKRYSHGSRERSALRDVSLMLDRGELVAVWGLRGSGRSTLLRLAAGIEAPDGGVVRFEGEELLSDHGMTKGIAYCRHNLDRDRHLFVLDEVAASSLARGETPSRARAHAISALERAGVEQCFKLSPYELDSAERARVGIARALVTRPSLLLIDEPTTGVDPLERDRILKLLRSLTLDGITVLTSVSEGTGLFGADRALTLSNGEIHGSAVPELAPVVPLPWQAIA